MPIKLIQVQRKLNVGINTVVEFLRKKGFEVEDNNPNTRIGDEQYALLVKEFGKDLPNGGRERERVVPERSHREASSVKEEKSSEIKTVIPEEFRPKIVTKGRIDLDRPHKKVQEVQHQPVSVPVEKKVEKPVEAATAAKTAEINAGAHRWCALGFVFRPALCSAKKRPGTPGISLQRRTNWI